MLHIEYKNIKSISLRSYLNKVQLFFPKTYNTYIYQYINIDTIREELEMLKSVHLEENSSLSVGRICTLSSHNEDSFLLEAIN